MICKFIATFTCILQYYIYICTQITTNTMKQEFKVFKKGTTEKPIIILSNNREPFNRFAKIAKYKYLGYTITDLKNNPL